MCRRSKNNPCLIGEPGVGKTAIVEGLALEIVRDEAPDFLKNKRIVSLDVAVDAVVSGLMEFVTGTVKIASLDMALSKKLILTAAIVGFAGVSVHAQVMAVIARYNLSLFPYIAGKALHGVLAAAYMAVYLHFAPVTEAVMASGAAMSKAFCAASLFELVTAAAAVAAFLAYAVARYVKGRRARV